MAARRSYHQWQPHETEIVRRDYRGTNQSAARIAGALGVTPEAVKGKAHELGVGCVTDHPPRKAWTPEQDALLEELITRLPVRQIAVRMGRGVNSVAVRAKRLGFSRRIRDGWYTLSEAVGILGVDHKWLKRRMDDGELRAEKSSSFLHPGQNGGAYWRIAEADLRRYVLAHAGELNGRNVDLVQLVDILTGGKVTV